MQRALRHFVHLTLAASAAALGGCSVQTTDDQPRPDSTATATAGDAAALPAPAPADTTPAAPPPPDTADMRLEVDVTARRLHVFRGDTRTASYPVAVGSAEWPTRTGQWAVEQVVFNPEWIPPDESWAEERERKAPGARDNPLGRAQLIYDPPRTIHGTDQPSSIGKAVSHGSIRMDNRTITQLAREVMEVTGAGKDEAWYREAAAKRTEKRVVDLPKVVPIRVF